MSAKDNKKQIRKRMINAYLSSVISISLLLLLVGLASLVVINARNVSSYFKENMKVSVMMGRLVEEPEAEEYIKQVSRLQYVKDTKLITREQGTKEMAEILGEDFLSAFDTSPVPVSVEVGLKAEYVVADSLDFIVKALSDYEIVEEVDARQGLVEMLNANIAKISLVFAVFIALLLFISFVLINNMVRLSFFSKRFTIHTMKLVGATKSFIRAPFVRSAVVQGLVSAAISSLALAALYYVAQKEFPQLFNIFTANTLLLTIGVMFACGVLICVISTFLVVGKMIRMSKDDLYY